MFDNKDQNQIGDQHPAVGEGHARVAIVAEQARLTDGDRARPTVDGEVDRRRGVGRDGDRHRLRRRESVWEIFFVME